MNITKDKHNAIYRDWKGLTVNIMKEFRLEYFATDGHWYKIRDYKLEQGAWDAKANFEQPEYKKRLYRVVWLKFHIDDYGNLIQITNRAVYYMKSYF